MGYDHVSQLDSLRDRLHEKESQLEVKSRAVLSAHAQHQDVCRQLSELRDQCDVKQRKADSAQKRVCRLLQSHKAYLCNEIIAMGMGDHFETLRRGV